MRRIRLFTELVSLPAAIIIFIVVVLGNVNPIVSILPELRPIVESAVRISWVSQALSWLIMSWLPNWAGLLLIVMVIALYDGAFRRLAPYYWPKPTLTFSTQVETQTTPDGEVTYASLVAHNEEDHEITDCVATLETGTNLFGPQMTPMATVRNNRLRWMPGQQSSDDCRLSLPRSSTRTIAVADTSRGFNFASCRPSGSTNHGLLGIYLVQVRVDGKLRGKDIEPQRFDGYLYVEDTKGDGSLSLIFGKSDWRKDPRLRKVSRQSLWGRLFGRKS